MGFCATKGVCDAGALAMVAFAGCEALGSFALAAFNAVEGRRITLSLNGTPLANGAPLALG
jgi:hypothetical protein